MTTIVVANQKGGVGKTTLACLLAWWLAERNTAPVWMIDLDAQGNASRTFAAHRSGLASADLFASAPLAEIGEVGAGLRLVHADARLTEVDARADAPAVFARQMTAMQATDYTVVIDTPPALGRRMVAALVVADWVLCPIELEDYSIDGLTAMLKTIIGVRTRWNPRLRLLGIVANRFNHHSAAQRAALEQLLARHGEHVVPWRLATRSAIPEALARGLPVWRLQKSAARDAAAEVRKLFALLDARMAPASQDA